MGREGTTRATGDDAAQAGQDRAPAPAPLRREAGTAAQVNSKEFSDYFIEKEQVFFIG